MSISCRLMLSTLAFAVTCGASLTLSAADDLSKVLPTKSVPGSKPIAPDYLSGTPFQTELNREVGRAWTGETLRDIVRQLSSHHKVAILLDRRIDPTVELNLTLKRMALHEVIAAVAQKVDASTTVIGHVIYIGPPETARKLRTLVALRNEELAKQSSLTKIGGKAEAKSAEKKRLSTTDRRSFVWDDLERPRELLKQIADKFQIEIKGLDQIPHDLWAASALPQATSVEALTLLLAGFDSSFELLPDRSGVRIVPMPQQALVERTLPLPKGVDEKSISALREKFQKAELKLSGVKLLVRASAEDLAAITDSLRSPNGPKNSKPETTSPDKPPSRDVSLLAQKRFTLTLQNTEARQVIKAFRSRGIPINYSEEAFADAEISLERKLDIDVKDVPLGKILRDLFEPLGVEVTFSDRSVDLTPKPKKKPQP